MRTDSFATAQNEDNMSGKGLKFRSSLYKDMLKQQSQKTGCVRGAIAKIQLAPTPGR